MAQTLSTTAKNSLDETISVLKLGSLVAIPTDTVYGLSVKYDDSSAIRRLYDVKERPANKAIPILVGDASALSEITSDFPPNARILAERFWPGALTLIVKRSHKVPSVAAPGTTVAVRMPAHQWLLSLLILVGPLAVSSANLSGQPPNLTGPSVAAALGKHIDLIIDGGQAQEGKPSTIVDCSVRPPVVLRDGPITAKQIHAALDGAA